VIQENLMRVASSSLRRLFAVVVAVPALALSTLVISAGLAPAAHADAAAPVLPSTPGPILQEPASAVTADALPTVQIDGVAWSQVINGNTVYAGGSFANARKAGAAAGTNLIPRSNLLSYNLTTGVLNSSFAPSLNAQVLALALTPDGSKLFVGGDFTTADGVAHSRIAAYNTSTGVLISTFTASANASVRSIIATNSVVYIGGDFTSINGITRNHLAAFNISANYALTTWKPSADYSVRSMVLTPDLSQVDIAGSFQYMNGIAAYGMAAVKASDGTMVPWAAVDLIRDAGSKAGITSLTTDGNAVYGTAYGFGTVTDGNFEGTFSADPYTGAVNWMESCHGDTYGAYSDGSTVYTVSHAHFCGNIGAFPQSNPWSVNMRHSLAFTTQATGTNLHDPYAGSTYFDWGGQPAPSLINWFPDFTIGTYTGQGQAAWTVTGNGNYVVEGGEFPAVNYVGQQGLVRFATKALTTPKQGPRLVNAAFVPSVASLSPGTVRVAIPSNWDRDDLNLTYRLYRSGQSNPVYTVTSASTFWNLPTMGFTDTGLTPGSTYTYRVTATDSSNNLAYGSPVTVTVAAGGGASQYSTDVLAAGPTDYWRLGETTGSTAYDYASFNDLTMYGNYTRGTAGAIGGDTNAATTFDGSSGYGATSTAIPGPNTFTIEAWFNTTSTTGGKIVSFGDQNQTLSGNYDRHIYMDPSGKVWFGVYNNGSYTINTSGALNDGQWHQVIGELSPAGMVMYVDGIKVGINTGTNVGQAYSGYWRVGGDTPWNGNPFFNGAIDDVAIYPSTLSALQVQQHYSDSGRTVIGGTPTDTYGKAIVADQPDVYYRLDDATGPAAIDYSGNANNGVYSGTETFGVPSPVSSTAKAVTFDGSSGSLGSGQQEPAPSVYSEEAWFNTTTTGGGKIIGFGNAQSGQSQNYDRHIYMETGGQLTFGTYTGQLNTATSKRSYNDGKWHYVAATQGPDGMKLFVDGQLVGTNPQTQAQGYNGYWRVGGDTCWNNTVYFGGTIDEAAAYLTELTPTQIQAHYQASPAHNNAPTAKLTTTVTDLAVTADATGSTTSDGTVPTYNIDFGDGSTANTATASHTYAAPGTYPVTLTVTDDGGLTATTTSTVTVSAHIAPNVQFNWTQNNQIANFDATATTLEPGFTATYAWDFGDGNTGTGSTPTHTYTTAGNYTVVLTVTDSSGATGTKTDTVNAAAHQNPTVSFTGTVNNLEVAFAGSAVLGDGANITGYAWDFGDGGTSTIADPSHTFATVGAQTVTLTVTDSQGAIGSKTQTVTTVHTAPSAAFTSTVANLAVSFNAATSKAFDAATITGYSWDFGDKTSGTGVRPNHTYNSVGTFKVLLTVTDSLGSTDTFTGTVTTLATHANPTASFTNTPSNLTVAFDGTSSTAADSATITDYVWNYGDGTPAGSGATPSHTYATAGTYQVTLTVTDSQSATGTVKLPVVLAVHPNPTASFTNTATGLSVAFDGSASQAADGATIKAYAWTFGDSTSGAGVTTTHAYTAGGTYSATLTVTDSLGATNVSTVSVTVSAPAAAVAADTFNRAATGGWGTADTGGSWTAVGSTTVFSVANGVGKLALTRAGTGPSIYLNSPSVLNSDVLVDFSVDKVPGGAGAYIAVAARHTSGGEYRAKVLVSSTGAVTVLLVKVVGSTETSLKGIAIGGLTVTTTDTLRIRFDISGTAPATLMAKVWKVGTTEPTAFQLTTTDATAGLQVAGGFGMWAYLSGTATNFPVTVLFDNLLATAKP
jgi:PKD repeat protein